MQLLLDGEQSLFQVTKDIIEQRGDEISSEEKVVSLCENAASLIEQLTERGVLQLEPSSKDTVDRRILVERWVFQMADEDEARLDAILVTIAKDAG